MQPQTPSPTPCGVCSFSSLKYMVEQRGAPTQQSAHMTQVDAAISEIANLSIFDCEINTYGTNIGLINVRVLPPDNFSLIQLAATDQSRNLIS